MFEMNFGNLICENGMKQNLIKYIIVNVIKRNGAKKLKLRQNNR